MSSGVLKGSHLGLILFNMYDVLKDDIDKFVQWCDINGMALNAAKCIMHVLLFTRI